MAVHNDEDDHFWLFHCTGVDQDSISGHYLEKIGTYAIAIEDRKYRLVKKEATQSIVIVYLEKMMTNQLF